MNEKNGMVGFYPGGGTSGYFLLGSDIGGIKFGANKKPTLLNRMMVKLLLGWEWVDEPLAATGCKNPTLNGVELQSLRKPDGTPAFNMEAT